MTTHWKSALRRTGRIGPSHRASPLSEDDEPPQRPAEEKTWNRVVVVVVIAGAVAIACLLR